MTEIIKSCGLFFYPLAICSLTAVFIIVERFIALRSWRSPAILLQKQEEEKSGSIQRIITFHQTNRPSSDVLKAYVQLEVNHLERGVFLLELIVGVAPLIGLLGTVTGLVQVFYGINVETGLPEPSVFAKGIALALMTTLVGLSIAIVALVGSSYIHRRVELLVSRLQVFVERLSSAI